MIIIKNLEKSILGDTLFENVNFKLTRGDKVGFIGKNGGGKTTLMKVILGLEEADSGTVDTEKERIAYVPQDIVFEENDTAEKFLQNSGNLDFKNTLKKVGLEDLNLEQKINELSGGQKTRLAIAKAMLEKPSVLFMDEPTNHLDTEGLQWLENFVKDFFGIVFIISHDRKFLDNCIDRIYEIDSANKEFNEYMGNYTYYLEEKERRIENQIKNYDLQQKRKKEMEEWLRLKRQEATIFVDPAKGRQIRAMEKRLQREIYDQELVSPKSDKDMRDLEFAGETHLGKLILRVSNLSFNFRDRKLFHKVNFEIRGKDRIFLEGENGSGKTTLLMILLGLIKVTEGEIRIGEGVRIGYSSQNLEFANLNFTVLEDFDKAVSKTFSEGSKNILGSFLFSGNSVNKKIKELSFGERVRLTFAKLIHSEYDLLILDEPTNHLDIKTREIIEDALQNYAGALLVVSHDRYFVEQINLNWGLKIENRNLVKKLF